MFHRYHVKNLFINRIEDRSTKMIDVIYMYIVYIIHVIPMMKEDSKENILMYVFLFTVQVVFYRTALRAVELRIEY